LAADRRTSAIGVMINGTAKLYDPVSKKKRAANLDGVSARVSLMMSNVRRPSRVTRSGCNGRGEIYPNGPDAQRGGAAQRTFSAVMHLEIEAVETLPCGVASNRKMSCRRGA